MCVYQLCETRLHIPGVRFMIVELHVTINGIILRTVLFQKEAAILKQRKERRGRIKEAGRTGGKRGKTKMVMVSE